MSAPDPKLLRYATPAQHRKVQAWIDLGTSTEAGKALGVNPAGIRQALAQVKRKAIRQGYCYGDAEKDYTAKPGEHSRGTSTLVNGDGEIVQRWHKTATDRIDKWALIRDAFDGLESRMEGRSKVALPPTETVGDLLAVYAAGDPHLGLAGWASKSGDDFDSNTMTRELMGAIQLLANRTPPTAEALLINEGDFFHYDNPGKTTTRGTPQDTDIPMEIMVDMGVDLMVANIEILKARHGCVWVMTVKGNHDDTLSYALAKILQAYYRNDPRVHILVSHNTYQYFGWGNNLFGGAHGNYPKKLADLEGVMAHDCDRNGLWQVGGKQKRVWYTGHVHHERTLDLRNCKVITSRTLAPGSVWSHEAGYRSFQSMNCDLYHREYGPSGNSVVGIEEIRDHVARGA